jgi:hypothetical protein
MDKLLYFWISLLTMPVVAHFHTKGMRLASRKEIQIALEIGM